MAYIIGLLSEEEEAELTRRGWEVEDAPAVDFDSRGASLTPNKRLKMVWVDSSIFQIMDGPDWDKGDCGNSPAVVAGGDSPRPVCATAA